jgi:hypothetical protein
MLPHAVAAVRQMGVVLVLSVWLIAAACAPAAAAVPRAVPPDNSAIDEFLTTAPGPTGDERLPRGEDVPSAVTGPSRTRLSVLGPEGERAITLLDQSAPAERPGGGRRRADADPRARSRAPVREVAGAVAGEGAGEGLGPALPALLLAALAGALVAVIRHRTSPAPQHEGLNPDVSNRR